MAVLVEEAEEGELLGAADDDLVCRLAPEVPLLAIDDLAPAL
jgi:hypothetical protein